MDGAGNFLSIDVPHAALHQVRDRFGKRRLQSNAPALVEARRDGHGICPAPWSPGSVNVSLMNGRSLTLPPFLVERGYGDYMQHAAGFACFMNSSSAASGLFWEKSV